MKNKRQIVNSLMVKFNRENGVSEYQSLFLSFFDYLNSSESKEIPSKMQIGHFLENFLRVENIQDSLTITDVQGLMDLEYISLNINNIKMYQDILLLLYEELSSNDKYISNFIKTIFINVNKVLSNIQNENINELQNTSFPDCFNCDRKFICQKDTRNVELIEQLHNEDQKRFSELTKNVKDTIKEINENQLLLNIQQIQLPFNNNNDKDLIKEYLLNKNIFSNECSRCGIKTWNNKFLSMELDIFDLNRFDINNYKFLCPNCYSQIGQ